MTPYYRDDWLTIYQGDVRAVLPELASDSVDCIVTSPPYWGLRDYGNAGQLGLERTPDEYVANLVAIFRELRRVLKPSGTCWLNLGDSYANSAAGGDRRMSDATTIGRSKGKDRRLLPHAATASLPRAPKDMPPDLKPKDLVGIPWRVAFALQADGWYLRSDIIWAKPNPMPESVTDRPTKAHEYLFLLTKSARYYFDADAVREAFAPPTQNRFTRTYKADVAKNYGNHSFVKAGADYTRWHAGDPNAAGRNIRSVWTIATRPYPGAHFAVFPPELPERCIKAGSSERGVCPHTGEPWERVTERSLVNTEGWGKATKDHHADTQGSDAIARNGQGRAGDSVVATVGWRPTCGAPWERVVEREQITRPRPNGTDRERDRGGRTDGFTKMPDGLAGVQTTTTGWQPTCAHNAEPVPAVVLDPFAGSGTTGMVANRLSRRAILVDLNGDYLKQQLQRNAQTPLGLAT